MHSTRAKPIAREVRALVSAKVWLSWNTGLGILAAMPPPRAMARQERPCQTRQAAKRALIWLSRVIAHADDVIPHPLDERALVLHAVVRPV
ncbi:hypothetical protein GCM10019060_12160 [Novosphingobium pokkalii]|nr:hypothetical protein GCM10019060_12160 [Novosphingobium pokkalii]